MGFFKISINFVVCIIEFMVVYQFFCHFMSLKLTNPILRGLVIVFVATMQTFINNLGFTYINSAGILFLTLLMTNLIFKCKIVTQIIYIFGFTAVLIATENLTIILFSAFFNKPMSSVLNDSNTIIIMTMVSKLLLLVVYRCIILFSKNRFVDETHGKSILPLLLLPAISTYVMFLLIFYDKLIPDLFLNRLHAVMAGLGLLFSNVIVFYIYDKSIEKNLLEHQLALAEQSKQTQEMLLKQQEQNIREMQSEYHDFKSHLNMIKAMNKNCDDQVVDYINELNNNLTNKIKSNMINFQNPVLNILLKEKQQYCKENQILFDADIEYWDFSFITSADTNAMFGNAFDNAIYACQQISGDNKIRKYIRMQTYRLNDIILVCIENSKCNEVLISKTTLISTKPEKENHGFGILNIKKAAKRYDGTVNYDYDQDNFRLTIRLNVPIFS